MKIKLSKIERDRIRTKVHSDISHLAALLSDTQYPKPREFKVVSNNDLSCEVGVEVFTQDYVDIAYLLKAWQYIIGYLSKRNADESSNYRNYYLAKNIRNGLKVLIDEAIGMEVAKEIEPHIEFTLQEQYLNVLIGKPPPNYILCPSSTCAAKIPYYFIYEVGESNFIYCYKCGRLIFIDQIKDKK
jgi:hypothetical protein